MNRSSCIESQQARSLPRCGKLVCGVRKLRQTGQSMTEFIIIAPVLLFVCLGTLQFVLLYQAKSTLDVAVLEAAREGAVNNGSMQAMRNGLARGLAPLYAREASAEGAANALAKAQVDATQFSAIAILNPSPTAVMDYARPQYYADEQTTYTEIPNDSLMYRDPTVPAGSDPDSNLRHVNIQDANILKIHVHYCYDMYVPLVNKVIYYATNVIGIIGTTGILTREPAELERDPYGAPKNGDSLCKIQLKDGIKTGRWPISMDSEAIVRMQSPFRPAASTDSPNPIGN